MSVAEVVDAARALAAHGLVDAFGHVSARTAEGFAITPPVPLGQLARDAPLTTVPLDADALPPGAPKEAWIHLAIYRSRPDVGGVCRAQPEAVNVAAGAGLALRPLLGQSAMLGPRVPLHDDARLVRERVQGEAVAVALGEAAAVVLRGNGAVTAAASAGAAVAAMYVLELGARANLAAAAIGGGRPLDAAEVAAWGAVAPELLGRLWAHLRDAV